MSSTFPECERPERPDPTMLQSGRQRRFIRNTRVMSTLYLRTSQKQKCTEANRAKIGRDEFVRAQIRGRIRTYHFRRVSIISPKFSHHLSARARVYMFTIQKSARTFIHISLSSAHAPSPLLPAARSAILPFRQFSRSFNRTAWHSPFA